MAFILIFCLNKVEYCKARNDLRLWWVWNVKVEVQRLKKLVLHTDGKHTAWMSGFWVIWSWYSWVKAAEMTASSRKSTIKGKERTSGMGGKNVTWLHEVNGSTKSEGTKVQMLSMHYYYREYVRNVAFNRFSLIQHSKGWDHTQVAELHTGKLLSTS